MRGRERGVREAGSEAMNETVRKEGGSKRSRK